MVQKAFISSFRLFFFKICNYCKSKGAHTGCCFNIGTDLVEKFCPKSYHIDCDHVQVGEQENSDTSAELYDVGTNESIANQSIEIQATASPDPLGEGATGYSRTECETVESHAIDYELVEFLEFEDGSSVKDEPFNLAMLHTSLNTSDDSDCMVTAAYYVGSENSGNVAATAETEQVTDMSI